MRTKLLAFVIFFSLIVPAGEMASRTATLAQSVDTVWVRRYNGLGNSSDVALAMAVDGSGNVYVTGQSIGSGTGNDYATIKYDQAGNQLWVQRYNGTGDSADCARAMAVDGSGNVYVTGESFGSGTSPDYATIKYLPNGDTAWVRRYNGTGNGNDYANSIAVDDSGNVYVTGYGPGSGGWDNYGTIRYYPNGDTAWVRRYNGPGNMADWAQALAVDGSGNVYVTGWSVGSGTDADYATVKYLPNGDTAWVRRYNRPGGNEGDYASALAVDDSGNVSVTGWSYTSGSSWDDYTTIKYLPNGDTAWVRTYNGPGNNDDVARAIAIDGSGNVYVTGLSFGSGTGEDYCTIKYNSNGDTAWVRRYNGPGNAGDDAHAIAVDASGNVYVSGESFGSGANYDYVTIKYDPDGYTIWEKRYNGPANGHDHAYAMAYGYNGIYVTGGSDGTGTNVDFATMNYVEYLCGDANGDGKVDLVDVLYLFYYCFKEGEAPPIFKGSGDVDGYNATTIRDIAYLAKYVFGTGDPPDCERVGEYVPSGELADTITSSPNILPANVGTISLTLTYKNSSPIIGLAYPLKVEIGGSTPHIDTAIIGSRMSFFDMQAATADTLAGTVNVGFLDVSSPLPAGYGTMLTLNLSIPPEPFDRQITLDTLRLSPSNYPLFLKPMTLNGVVPGYVPEHRSDTLNYYAYSPVDLIVTAPNGDSIGTDFNTIPNASYDTTTDRNLDGSLDDIVTIPNPLTGEYLVRVIRETVINPGDTSYSLGIRIDGSNETIVATNATVPPPGEVDTIVYDVTVYLRGDANSDGKKTVSDVVFLINYLFKSGQAPLPSSLGDANYCLEGEERVTVSDVVFLVNYLFKAGPAPCS